MSACLAAACACGLLLLLVGSPAAGEWVPAASARTCEEKLLCVGSNVTWATAHEYGAEDGCRAIASKGLTAIKFYGDSFMRHMYEGLVLTLTGAQLRRHSGPMRCWQESCLVRKLLISLLPLMEPGQTVLGLGQVSHLNPPRPPDR